MQRAIGVGGGGSGVIGCWLICDWLIGDSLIGDSLLVNQLVGVRNKSNFVPLQGLRVDWFKKQK